MIHLKISCKYLDSSPLNTSSFFSRNKDILLHNCQTLYHKQKKKSRNKVILLCNCQTPYHKQQQQQKLTFIQ